MVSDEVRRSAARVQQLGGEVRQLADRILAAGATEWRSTAAAGFRHRLIEEATRIRAAAAEMDGAAEALLHHAGAIDAMIARFDLGGSR